MADNDALIRQMYKLLVLAHQTRQDLRQRSQSRPHPVRQKMVREISSHLTKKQDPALLVDKVYRQKIRNLAQEIEKLLYTRRSSYQEYANAQTLPARIESAYALIAKAHSMRRRQAAARLHAARPGVPTLAPSAMAAGRKTKSGLLNMQRIDAVLGANAPRVVAPPAKPKAKAPKGKSKKAAALAGIDAQVAKMRLASARQREKAQTNPTPQQKAERASNTKEHMKIQHKRRAERIVVLLHAKHCKLQKCPKTWCPYYKTIYKHVSKCRAGSKCKFEHCFSSQDVLRHYQTCKDKRKCLTCSQVRDVPRPPPSRRQTKYVSDLVSVFTQTQLRHHFTRIRAEFNAFYTTETLQYFFSDMLKKMCESEYGFVFAKPVDPNEWKLHDYREVVQRPMDLGTIRKRLDSGRYTNQRPESQLHPDIMLVFENALKYSKPGQMIAKIAQQMKEDYEKKYNELLGPMYRLEAENRDKRGADGNYLNCGLCGGGAIFLQPPILYCTMCLQKIKRNSTYYASDLGDSRPYCSSCYSKVKDKSIKDSLVAHKHTTNPQEEWIECEKCRRWFHHVCGLFNSTKVHKDAAAKNTPAKANGASGSNGSNSREKAGKAKGKASKKTKKAGQKRKLALTRGGKKGLPPGAALKEPDIQDNNNIEYTCPFCTYEERQRLGAEGPTEPLVYRGAKHLPLTKMTNFIEKRIMKFLQHHYRIWSVQKEVLGYDPRNLDSRAFGHVQVRCVSNIEREYHSSIAKKNPLLLEWLKKQYNYSLDFKGRTKAILLFQEIDQVDVCFFAMYVQEYDEDTQHKPNQKTCYIAYLDSVKYFRPEYLRTKLYYELLLSYFEWVKNRGFTRAYIWSCPPQTTEQDYILYCHPKTQKTPSNDRLRTWYRMMVIEGHARGIVQSCQTLHDAHMSDEEAKCIELPYYLGDYWPQISENFIKELKKPDKPNAKKTATAGALTPSSTASSPSNNSNGGGSRRATRSSDAPLVTGIGEKTCDPLMRKLAANISESKDNFLVLDLFETCQSCNKFIDSGEQWSCQECQAKHEEHWIEHTFKRGTPKLVAERKAELKTREEELALYYSNLDKLGRACPPEKRPKIAPSVIPDSSGAAKVESPSVPSTPHAASPTAGAQRDKKDNRTKKFHLCGECYKKHQQLPQEQRHPAGNPAAHKLTVGCHVIPFHQTCFLSSFLNWQMTTIASQFGFKNTKDVDAQVRCTGRSCLMRC